MEEAFQTTGLIIEYHLLILLSPFVKHFKLLLVLKKLIEHFSKNSRQIKATKSHFLKKMSWRISLQTVNYWRFVLIVALNSSIISLQWNHLLNTRFEKEEEKKNTLKLCNLHISGGVFSSHIPCNSVVTLGFSGLCCIQYIWTSRHFHWSCEIFSVAINSFKSNTEGL